MNCNRNKDSLALYVGGDLPTGEADKMSAHLQVCAECRRYCESLANNQLLMRTLRPEPVSTAALAEMREELFSRLETVQKRPGFWIRIERALMLETRRPRLAVAGVALAVIVSATLFAQLRHVTASPDDAAAVFESNDTLRLPESYRDWVFVGSVTELPHAGKRSQSVYMSPVAYREYKSTGTFPEGTVMVLESAKQAPEGIQVSLEASVKDRRFSQGWGYFRFEGAGGRLAARAQALPESAGCVACHRDRGAADHVFTQFYPILRSASGVL